MKAEPPDLQMVPSPDTPMRTPPRVSLALFGILVAAAAHGQTPKTADILWSYDTDG